MQHGQQQQCVQQQQAQQRLPCMKQCASNRSRSSLIQSAAAHCAQQAIKCSQVACQETHQQHLHCLQWVVSLKQHYHHCSYVDIILQISTVNMGLAVGWSAVILGYGTKGLRKSLPHSLGECVLQQSAFAALQCKQSNQHLPPCAVNRASRIRCRAL